MLICVEVVTVLNGETPQTETRKRSRWFYLVLAVTFLLIVMIMSAVFLGQTSYGPGPLDIEVASDKQIYLQGEEVNFTIYVNNPHDWTVPYPNSVSYIIEKNGLYVTSVGGGQITYTEPTPMFSPDSKTLYQELLTPWNQKLYVNGALVQAQPGNYTLTVSFDGAVDYGDSGNCTFEIR